MITAHSISRLKIVLPALFLFIVFPLTSQTQKTEFPGSDNAYAIPDNTWIQYLNKTALLLEKVDVQSFMNYVVVISDGNLADMSYFRNYVSRQWKSDYDELVYKVGKGDIINEENVKMYLSSLQPEYLNYFSDFQKNRDEIITDQNKSGPSNPHPDPLNCGAPCTNPGFESGSGFWDYWAGNPSTGTNPGNLTSGFNPPPPGFFGTNPNPHLITSTGGFDATVGGTILPVVPPGGGNNAFRLGDLNAWGSQSWGASRASISFTVSASNANFTYRYAVVLHDPTSGHTDAERPYFRIKVRDAGGNVVTCGDYEVMAKPGTSQFAFFVETGNNSDIWYRPWTSVFIPLQTYIGQCITVEFTSSDCSQGGHLGYAYVDCACDPLEIIASSPNICGGNDVTLTAPAGGASYSWTDSIGGTSGIVGSATNQTAIVTLGGTYHVVITSVAGPTCTTALDITIGTNPSNPVAQFTNATVCHGAPMQFTDTSTPLGSITGWKWDFDNDGITDDTLQNPSHIFTLAGVYPVKLTIAWGACNADTIINITVNPGVLPVLTPAGPFCTNAPSVNLIADMPGGIWKGFGITDSVSGTFTPSVSVIGIDTVTYTIGGSCSAISSQVIIVNPIPVADAGPDVNICSGVASSIGTAYSTGYSYAWVSSTGLSSASVSNPDITAVNNGTVPVVLTYTVTTSHASCSSTDQVIVTINPQPVLTITDPAAVCAPQTIDVTSSAVTLGSTGGGTFTYFTNSGATIPLSAPATVGNSGTYFIKVTANGGCSDIQPVEVTINPLPVADAGVDLTICSGGSGNIGTTATSGYTYSWTPASGITGSTTISNPAVSLSNPGPAPAISTIYTVTTLETSSGCQSTDVVNVITGAVTTVNAGSAQFVCSGSDITLSGSVGGSATSGTWSGGTGTYSPDNLSLNAIYSPSAAESTADSVVLTLTTNDPAGPCTFSSSTVTVYFYKIPDVVFLADMSVGCPVHCTNFTNLTTVSGGASVQNWNWDFGDGSPSSSSLNPVHCFEETGFYDIALTAVSDQGCGSTLTQSHLVEVYVVPEAAFDPTPNPATVLDPIVTFNNQSSSDVNYWHWDFGDSTTLAPNTPSPVHTYPNEVSSSFMVTLIVRNSNGCYDTVAKEIFIGPEFTFFIPNAFSPNGDKINDYFYGSGIGIIKYDLWIFDRWGDMIFHSKDLDIKWDGKSNGGENEAQIDVYVWKVTLTDVFNKEHSYTGTVTLVK